MAAGVVGQTRMPTAEEPKVPMPTPAAFARGVKAGLTSVFAYVLFGTFIGYGALCHDLGFSLAWSLVSTVIVWAGPAQVIVVTTLGTGAPLGEVAVAVALTGMRFVPMVAAIVPVI